MPLGDLANQISSRWTPRLRVPGLAVAPSLGLLQPALESVALGQTKVPRIGVLRPTISDQRTFAEADGLMAYGANRADLYRQLAVYVDKILKGAKPSDLPVVEPTRFDLIINLNTAKALGLAIPPSVRLRADHVIHP